MLFLIAPFRPSAGRPVPLSLGLASSQPTAKPSPDRAGENERANEKRNQEQIYGTKRSQQAQDAANERAGHGGHEPHTHTLSPAPISKQEGHEAEHDERRETPKGMG